MKVSSDRLAQNLKSLLGDANVTEASEIRSRHTIDGTQPTLVCFPQEQAQVAAALRVCSDAEARVAPCGGGTAMQIGNPPSQIDLAVVLERLDRLIEHDHANLTVTVEAGTKLAALQEILAAERQFLALDPPYPNRATVGGVLATNLNGPRRSFYGSVRDLVIGMRVALLKGELIKAGGKVVKNVAGYDMCKLFVGSLGSLGIITEATLRVTPLPEIAASFVASGALTEIWQLVRNLRSSILLPAAVVVLNSPVNDAPAGNWKVAVCCEGFQESVERHLRELAAMTNELGLASHILRDDLHHRFWGEVRDQPLEANRTIFRITVPLTAVPKVLETVRASAERETSPHVIADTCTGAVWISCDSAAAVTEWFSTLTTLAREQRGHAITLAASVANKQGLDVWGPVPPSFSIMREIKRQFDPAGLLNPGRFLGGL
jgi:glycolate oxidase FAD binding subunit